MSKKEAETAIKVSSVTKSFILPHKKSATVKGMLSKAFSANEDEKQLALQDISFEIKKGEFFGIVGRNGSGKSTLLKCMAGVYTPDKGSIRVNGSLVPFIELGVGFNPELTGRENVYLNGALLGFSREEMDSMYDEIVEFAELERFMDQQLKNYSSGMQVRLAFSIAIQAKGDILLLDEVLAVGDSSFQKKCYSYFEELKEKSATIILVSHNMDAVERFCDRAVLINDGELKKIGSPEEIAQLYSDINIENERKNIVDKLTKKQVNLSEKNKNKLSAVIQSSKGGEIESLRPNEDLIITVMIDAAESIDDAALGIIIYNSRKIPIFATNTRNEKVNFSLKKNSKTILEFKVKNIFSNDTYSVSLGLRNFDNTVIYALKDNVAHFASTGRRHAYAVACPDFSINIIEGK